MSYSNVNLFIVHSHHTYVMQKAFTILEMLLKLDDEVVQVWYLMGWLYFQINDFESATFYLQQCVQVRNELAIRRLPMLFTYHTNLTDLIISLILCGDLQHCL